MIKPIVLCAVVGGVIASGSAQATPVFLDTGFGNGADAAVSVTDAGPAANVNRGDTAGLTVLNNGFSNHIVSFLRFDLTGTVSTITDARLDLVLMSPPQDSTATFNVSGLNPSLNADNWDESTITGRNQPVEPDGGVVPRGDSTPDPSRTTFLGQAAVGAASAGSVVSFSGGGLTPFLNSSLGDLLTLILWNDQDDVDFGHAFGSKESDLQAPTLALSFSDDNGGTPDNPSQVPEPGTLAMLVLGLAALGGRARRRLLG